MPWWSMQGIAGDVTEMPKKKRKNKLFPVDFWLIQEAAEMKQGIPPQVLV